MRFIADFHLHSRYSRGTSKDMEVETLALWAKRKGITLLGTGDFTHPIWFQELKTKLEPLGNGLLTLKNGPKDLYFMLTGEVSNVFSQGGKVRRIHNLIFAPNFEVVERINSHLRRVGRLTSDGRPTFGFPSKDLVRLVLDVSADCLIIPAHAWTPWFSIFGANSGFDSLEECFGEEAGNIYAIETGLSSDPPMNWRLSALDKITLISNSDAHSPNKVGREANVFDCPLDYYSICNAIKERKGLLFTVEFFPEEGKYHYDGHRNCNLLFSPSETRKANFICPRCKKRLTIGVMHRVESLADRPEGFVLPGAIPYRPLVPLEEIIQEALGQRGRTRVEKEYQNLIQRGISEFNILLDLSKEELAIFTSPRALEGIMRVREGKLTISPGYDGVYGKVCIFPPEENEAIPQQMELF